MNSLAFLAFAARQYLHRRSWKQKSYRMLQVSAQVDQSAGVCNYTV